MTRPFKGIGPKLGERVFVDPSAQIIGDVELGDDVSVWMGAVIRGDVNRVRIGPRTNIQDLCVIHVDFGDLRTEVAEEVTVGHAAILHGCTVEARCLIGMGAIILNGARIGSESIVAAGALVPEGMVVRPRSVVMGQPARVRRTLDDEEVERLRLSAAHYVEYKDTYLAEAQAP